MARLEVQPAPNLTGMNDIEAGEAFADFMGSEGLDKFAGPSDDSPAPGADARGADAPSAADEPDADAASDATDAAGADESSESPDSQEAPDDANEAEEEDASLGTMFGVAEDNFIVDDDGVVRVVPNVDGDRTPVTFETLLKGYQTEASTTRKAMALAEQQREQQAAAEAQRTELTQATQQALQLAEAMRGRVAKKYEGVDWDALRVANPGEFAALRQQLSEELSGLDNEVAAIQHQYQQQHQQWQHQHGQQREQWLAEQRQTIATHVPEMVQASTRAPLMQEYSEYLSGLGFSAQELSSLADARMLRVINDAVKYRRAQKAANGKPSVGEKLKKVPRVRKPGPAGARDTTKVTRRKQSYANLRKSGSDEDAVRFAIDSGLADSLM